MDIRFNEDIDSVVIYHTSTSSTLSAVELNSQSVMGGDFGTPFDLIIDAQGRISASSRWLHVSDPSLMGHDISVAEALKPIKHFVSDASKISKFNKISVHVAVIGNFDNELPTFVHLNALKSVIDHIQDNLTIRNVYYYSELLNTNSPGLLFFSKDQLGLTQSTFGSPAVSVEFEMLTPEEDVTIKPQDVISTIRRSSLPIVDNLISRTGKKKSVEIDSRVGIKKQREVNVPDGGVVSKARPKANEDERKVIRSKSTSVPTDSRLDSSTKKSVPTDSRLNTISEKVVETEIRLEQVARKFIPSDRRSSTTKKTFVKTIDGRIVQADQKKKVETDKQVSMTNRKKTSNVNASQKSPVTLPVPVSSSGSTPAVTGPDGWYGDGSDG